AHHTKLNHATFFFFFPPFVYFIPSFAGKSGAGFNVNLGAGSFIFLLFGSFSFFCHPSSIVTHCCLVYSNSLRNSCYCYPILGWPLGFCFCFVIFEKKFLFPLLYCVK
ncbi:unnamed protein product, partial [Ixodes hexagonus]